MGRVRGFPVGIWERGCEMWNVGGGILALD